MTGIGFLGAGVIFKEGLNAASPPRHRSGITAAIGILVGIGFYFVESRLFRVSLAPPVADMRIKAICRDISATTKSASEGSADKS
jgi:hypothetical protein